MVSRVVRVIMVIRVVRVIKGCHDNTICSKISMSRTKAAHYNS
jgi:hypothetical protein